MFFLFFSFIWAGRPQGEVGEFVMYGLLFAASSGPDILAHEARESLARARLPPGDRCVAHALATCRAYAVNDYVGFLRLYDGAPRMAPYLMDLLLERMRPRVYAAVLAAYDSVPLRALASLMGVTRRAAAAYVAEHGGAVTQEGGLDVKACRAGLRARA
jgi:SAC3 family protein LENG8/THP3